MNDREEATKPSLKPPLRSAMTVRQVALDYPATQEVFVRHGEPTDRATKFGHLEPLSHFARRRQLSLPQLLRELSAAAGVGVDKDAQASDQLHRPFLVWALAITLSLGAGWGAWLLFEIGGAGVFTAVSAADVVAHGETQLWGFIALFVLGIALRYLPMTTAQPRPAPWLRRTILCSLLAGVGGGFAWAWQPAAWPWLGPLSGSGLILATALFLLFILQQMAGKYRPTWARLILACASWLFLWACITLLLRWREAATGPGTYSSTTRLLLMQLAICGFTMNAIYGFGQKLLSGLLATASPRRGAIEATFWLHNAGAATLSLACLDGLALPMWPGVLLVAAGAVSYALGLRGFRRQRHTVPRPETGERFLDRYIQLAFFWLLAGQAMLVGGEVYGQVAGVSVPHAYQGGVRHALTVGFMTTLILGVGQRLLPVLGHTLLAWPRLVLPIFLLIGVGNLWRVATEVATLYLPAAYGIMPISSVLELTALSLFTLNALRTMWPRTDSLLFTGQATLLTPLAVLLAEYPWLEDHLFAWGLGYVGRVRAVPGELTLGTFIATEGQNPEEILARINSLLRESRPKQGENQETPGTFPGLPFSVRKGPMER